MTDEQTTLAAFLAADDAWSHELLRVFGKRDCGDKRYLPEGRGNPGTKLRRLHDARDKAMRAWDAAREASHARAMGLLGERV